MLDKESDARFIGYGAMIAESMVGILALIAACSLYPGDYFAIKTSPQVFSRLGFAPSTSISSRATYPSTWRVAPAGQSL